MGCAKMIERPAFPYLHRYGYIEALCSAPVTRPGKTFPYLHRYGYIEALSALVLWVIVALFPYLHRYGYIEAVPSGDGSATSS